MRFPSGWRRRNAVAAALAFTSAALFGTLQFLHAPTFDSGLGSALQALDSVVQDLALESRSPESYLQSTSAQLPVRQDPRSFITIVAIDERTIAPLGAYGGGYPRGYQAQLVERLLSGSPRVIAFDIGFFEPTPDDPALAADFADAPAARPP